MDPYPWPTSAAASAVMRGNRRRDTRPERALRSALHARGLRFRVDLPLRLPEGRPVRPDVVFTRHRVAVFVDGCFWHGCPAHGNTPRANADYWVAKIERNRARDRRVDAGLLQVGWSSLRVWEHEPVDRALERVVGALERSS